MGVLQNPLGFNLTDHDPMDHSLFSVGANEFVPHSPPFNGFLELLDDGTAFLLLDDNTDFLLLG
jgi:hypothetical protein